MLLRAACVALLLVIAVGAQDTPKPSASNVSNPAAPAPEAPLIPVCPAGSPLGAVDLGVSSPNNSDPLPFRSIIHLSEDDTLHYSPLLRGREKRPDRKSVV